MPTSPAQQPRRELVNGDAQRRDASHPGDGNPHLFDSCARPSTSPGLHCRHRAAMDNSMPCDDRRTSSRTPSTPAIAVYSPRRGPGTSRDLDSGLRRAPVGGGAGGGRRAGGARLSHPVAERGDGSRPVRDGRAAAVGDVDADDRPRHRQHLRPRRDDDRGGAEDAGRGVPRPLPPRARRQQPRARREGPRPRLRQAAVVHEVVPRGDGHGAVQRRRAGDAARAGPRRARSEDARAVGHARPTAPIRT